MESWGRSEKREEGEGEPGVCGLRDGPFHWEEGRSPAPSGWRSGCRGSSSQHTPVAQGLALTWSTCPLFFFFINLFIYLFLAALGLRCCAWAFYSCGVRASHCSGPSCCGARALGARASVVVACGLSSCGLRALERRLSSCGAQA